VDDYILNISIVDRVSQSDNSTGNTPKLPGLSLMCSIMWTDQW